MEISAEQIAEHLGRPIRSSLESTRIAGSPESLSVNVVYTEPGATGAALRLAESLARGLDATIHVRAIVSVPSRLSIDQPPVSVSFLKRLISEGVERFGSPACKYVLHMYLCRSRIETLLNVLRPSSLVVIGGRQRLWPTAESRLSKLLGRAGHHVAFFDLNTGYLKG